MHAPLGPCPFPVQTRSWDVIGSMSGLPLSAQPVDATQALNLSAGVAAAEVVAWSGRNTLCQYVPVPDRHGGLRRCASWASLRVIARPRPVPPNRWAVLASAWANSSKSFACYPGVIPMPVTETDSAMAAVAHHAPAQRHLALLGELVGVAQQVKQVLAQPRPGRRIGGSAVSKRARKQHMQCSRLACS